MSIISKKIEKVLGIIPVPIFYVDKIPFKPAWKGGMVYGPIIFIMDKYKDDDALLKHELWHAKQFWMTVGFHIPLYASNLFDYRLWSEIKAYHIQWLSYGKQYSDRLSVNLTTMYNLKIGKGYAKKCITAGYII